MLPNKTTKRERPRWKLEPHEVPPELRGNFIVEHLMSITPEQEASMERAAALDATLGDGRPEES